MKDEIIYQTLKWDPTANYQAKFKETLGDLKVSEVITNRMHRDLFPTNDQPPCFYGFSKVHKATMPLWPILSSTGTISYEVAEYFTKVLSPLVGKTEHYVKISKDFVKDVK